MLYNHIYLLYLSMIKWAIFEMMYLVYHLHQSYNGDVVNILLAHFKASKQWEETTKDESTGACLSGWGYYVAKLEQCTTTLLAEAV